MVSSHPISVLNPVVDLTREAFIYGLPLVLVDLTKEVSLKSKNPVNQFLNRTTFCTAGDTDVVRPNFDTYYSIAFFDLSCGPLVLGMPATGEQYYVMPLLDAFTNVIEGSPGKRTQQTQGGNYLLVGAKGLPDGFNTTGYTDVIQCGTDIVWAIGRFQVDNTDTNDYNVNGAGSVISLQSQLSIRKPNGNSAAYGGNHAEATITPNETVINMPIKEFFARLNLLLLTNPPAPEDSKAMEKFKKIGVGPGLIPFENQGFDAITWEAIAETPAWCINNLLTKKTASKDTNWITNLNPKMGAYGTDYLLRARIGYNGLGANLIQDAVYYSAEIDADGDDLDGSKYDYRITFNNGTPPNGAFWSLTMYNQDGFFIENTIGRYAVGHDATAPLQNVGDNVVIFIQDKCAIPNTDPLYANWLPSAPGSSTTVPAPSGIFNVMIRVYYPDQCVWDKDYTPLWTPPVIEKVIRL